MTEQGLIIEKHNKLHEDKKNRKDKNTNQTYEITKKGKNIVIYLKDRKRMVELSILEIY